MEISTVKGPKIVRNISGLSDLEFFPIGIIFQNLLIMLIDIYFVKKIISFQVFKIDLFLSKFLH